MWAPMSSFEKAVKASPTLRRTPEFLKKFKTSGFETGKDADYVIRGDLVAWQLRIAVSQSIGWSSEQDVQRYFAQVNKDLDDAFQQKRLHKSKKIMMLPSAVPRSSEEISALLKPTFVSWTYGALILRIGLIRQKIVIKVSTLMSRVILLNDWLVICVVG